MSNFQSYLVERLGLEGLSEFMAHKKVPMHKHSLWYYWGGITLMCFIVQVFSGILLMVYYQQGHQAYDSVHKITFDIHFGRFIRSVHSWTSTLFLASACVHMFSVFFMKAYRRPREMGWWTGMILLLMGLAFGFSGYLLPMDELAFFATKVGMSLLNSVPVVGHVMANLMRGGLEVGDNTVQRFFALHAVILPIIFMPILGLHIWLVQKHGMAIPASEEAKPEKERKSIPFFPNFLMKDLLTWLMTLNVIALLAYFYPSHLGLQADALKAASPGIHPEWYFMSSFQLLKMMGHFMPGTAGEGAGMGIFSLWLILWLLIPIFDVKTVRGLRGRLATYFGIAAALILIVMTIWGYAALK